MKTGSAPHVSSLARISLAAIALAALALAPQRALAQHGGGHFGGGHFGGGHVGGGASSGGSHAAPASHPANAAQAGSTAHVTPPVSGASTSAGGNAQSAASITLPASARPSVGSSVSTLSSSGVPAGLAKFAEPGTAGASSTLRARPSVTLGFPVSGATNWQPAAGQARVMTFSGQGRTLWQNSTGATTAAVPGRSVSASMTPAMILPGPPGFGARRIRGRFPIFGPGGFGFFGPGFGFFGFNDGFGFGNGFGCDPFWGWGCNAFGWGPGWGYGFNMYSPAGAYAQSDAQDDTSREYGPYAWQNPPASESQDNVAVSEPPTLIYLKDGTSYAVSNYWLSDYKLHYVTSYGGENAIDVNQLDFQRTVDENAQRGITFTLKPAPGAPMQSATPTQNFAPAPAGSPAQDAPPDSAAPLTPPPGTP